MVDLSSQYENIKEEIDLAIHEVIKSSGFINGKAVQEFGSNLANYLGVEHVIPCANGTDALQIALMALDLEAGDEVITTPFTFIATAEVISLLKLKPVFVDIDPNTFTIDIEQLQGLITNRTKCIIPVHLFGQACNMEAIMQVAADKSLHVIEDNAQAIGASYIFQDGTRKKLGSIGHIGCTSFFPSKNLGGYGDGGAISTNNSIIADKLSMIANHGSKERYYHDVIGVNSRLDTIQAAILKIKLNYLDEYIAKRQEAANYYNEAMVEIDQIQTPVTSDFSTHVFHQYTILMETGRDDLKAHLEKEDIPSMVYYPVPLHLQPAYSYLGYKEGSFPVTELLAKQVLSLPMHTELDNEQLEFICSTIKSFFN
ncbi:MAG: DegT/DnrJ/EryC1/StrS family aminotransferase [Bacteroidetes bacterium]|nr:DegT/DnrJ/EryC1/StrS family aminotransferase [Bacteroidota bacterium]